MFRQVYANKASRQISVSSSSDDASSDDEDTMDSHRRSAPANGDPELYEGQKRRDGQLDSVTDSTAEQPVAQKIDVLPIAPIPATVPAVIPAPMPKNNNLAIPGKQLGFDDMGPKSPGVQQPVAPVVPKKKCRCDKYAQRQQVSIMRVVFMSIGLLVGTIVYCLIGGLMFSYLEQSNEQAECEQLRYLYQKTRNATAFTLYDIAASPDMGDEDKLEAFLPILDTMRSSIHNISWDGRNCETMDKKWSLIGASFFSFTIVSTIGFGHM